MRYGLSLYLIDSSRQQQAASRAVQLVTANIIMKKSYWSEVDTKLKPGEMFAESFDNSDLMYRHEQSIYRGRDVITQPNMQRHVIKQSCIQNMSVSSKFRRAITKVMMATSWKMSAVAKSAPKAVPQAVSTILASYVYHYAQ